MDVERTIEFILSTQAKAEVRMDRTEARINQMEARFEKRLDAVTKLIRTGMKIINGLAEDRRKMRVEMRELAAAQRETQRTLKAFIHSLQRGGNGRRA